MSWETSGLSTPAAAQCWLLKCACVCVCVQVHLNCALWSSEVYETQAGALINVELALRRGLTLRCAHCQHTGATSGCNRLRCTNTYHFTCALQASCTFFKVGSWFCGPGRLVCWFSAGPDISLPLPPTLLTPAGQNHAVSPPQAQDGASQWGQILQLLPLLLVFIHLLNGSCVGQQP